MATTYYSDHFSPIVGATGHFTTQDSPQRHLSPGIKHGRIRRSAALGTFPAAVDLASGDIVRFLDLKNTDRLINLYFSGDVNLEDAADFNVGLYVKGANNDGAVIDVDLFETAVDWKGTIARVDSFANNTLDHWDRGKTLWELANIGVAATTYSGTGDLWTVAITASSNNAAVITASEWLCEAYYTAGD